MIGCWLTVLFTKLLSEFVFGREVIVVRDEIDVDWPNSELYSISSTINNKKMCFFFYFLLIEDSNQSILIKVVVLAMLVGLKL